MQRIARVLATLSVASFALVPAVAASAHATGTSDEQPAAFVQTNDPHGNAVRAYAREADGTLRFTARYATGGKGGAAANAVVDPLASSHSVVYDRADHLLFVVNAGSNSLSVFGVEGAHLSLRQVISSGGSFPTSIAVHDDLVYALDAGGHGAVQGYRIFDRRLHWLSSSTRSLGLHNANPPDFLTAPGEVGFTPDGNTLVITAKKNGPIDTFRVFSDGRLSSAPVANAAAGIVPFAFVFDGAGHLVVAEAGTTSVSTYNVTGTTITAISGPVSDGQAATCWIATARGYFYVANTGSGTLSAYRVASDGTVTLVGIAATPHGNPIDLIPSPDGHYLYSQNGMGGTVEEYRVNSSGTLTWIGHIGGLTPHVAEGFAVS
ncbi:MAG: hypothetical protein JWL83_4235 [Actinomycetia bacterium]|nr:hypothetical protein [Actinomycetes bacterium]